MNSTFTDCHASNQEVDVTLILPCLNEAQSLELLVSECRAAIASDPENKWEILLVDNDSTDNSAALAQGLGVKVIQVKDRGYGKALHVGILESNTKYIIYLDADGTYSPYDAITLLRKAKQTQAALIIGSRFKGTIEREAMPILHRYFGTPILSWLIRLVTGVPISDCNSGLRCINRAQYLKWVPKPSGMEFASQIILSAVKNEDLVVEVPINYRKRIDPDSSKLRTIKDGLSHLWVILTFGSGILLRRKAWDITLAALATLITLIFVRSTGLLRHFSESFSPHLIYRLQTEALLSGKTQVSESPFAKLDDAAWGIHGVEQQWGLGVPFLRLPFEALAKTFGLVGFPDRIFLAFIFFITAWFLIGQLFKCRFSGSDRFSNGMLVILCSILIFFGQAPFQLAASRFAHYEEAVFYSMLAAFLLLAGTLRMQTVFNTRSLYLISAFSGFVISIRPTIVAYVFPTIILLTVQILRQNEKVASRILKASLCFLLFAALTPLFNTYRFGSAFNFGHQVNMVYDPFNGYALRFGFPYNREPVLSAAKELLSALFWIKSLNFGDYFATDMLFFQSPTLRFREFYFRPFSLSSGVLLLICLITLPLGALLKRSRLDSLLSDSKINCLIVWGGLSFLLLSLFYMHAPSITSRYLVDFYPSIVAIFLAFLLTSFRILENVLSPKALRMTLVIFSILCLKLQQQSLSYFSLTQSMYQEFPPLSYSNLESSLSESLNVRALASTIPQILSLKCPSDDPDFDFVWPHCGWFHQYQCRVATMTQLFLSKSNCYEARMRYHPELDWSRNYSGRPFEPSKVQMVVNERKWPLQSVVSENEITKLTFCQSLPSKYLTSLNMVSIAWLPQPQLHLTPVELIEIRASQVEGLPSRL